MWYEIDYRALNKYIRCVSSKSKINQFQKFKEFSKAGCKTQIQIDLTFLKKILLISWKSVDVKRIVEVPGMAGTNKIKVNYVSNYLGMGWQLTNINFRSLYVLLK